VGRTWWLVRPWTWRWTWRAEVKRSRRRRRRRGAVVFVGLIFFVVLIFGGASPTTGGAASAAATTPAATTAPAARYSGPAGCHTADAAAYCGVGGAGPGAGDDEDLSNRMDGMGGLYKGVCEEDESNEEGWREEEVVVFEKTKAKKGAEEPQK
jgi:hypothetical protein